MITSKGEYLFVSGSDMDDIIIDGNVMPLRNWTTTTGQSAAKILRGEDVTLLLEAWAERLDLMGSSASYTFHKKLGVDMQTLLAAIYAYLPQGFVDAVPGEAYDIASTWWDAWVAEHAVDTSSITVAEDAFDSGKKMESYNMLAAFASMKNLSTIWSQRVSSYGGNSYGEIVSMDAAYPYQTSAGLTDGYRSYGGQNISDDHPNAYGGWEIKFSYDTIGDTLSAMQTTPAQVELFAHETYQKIATGAATASKYQFVKIGDCTVTDGHPSITDSASAQRARLIAAMNRYWSISPGFLSTAGQTLQVNVIPVAHNFIHTGDHTKWW